MLLRYRCNAVFPVPHAADVIAHFDVPGTRSIEIRCPRPGPVVDEIYTLDLNGSGLQSTQSQTRVGPDTPNDDMVICPHCTSQFGAIPVNVQTELNVAHAEVAHLREQLAQKPA